MRAVSAFTRSATGDYIQVRFRGSVGWVDQRDIRRASGGGGGGGGVNAPIVNTASGVAYRVTNVNNFASLRTRRSTQSRRLAQVPRGATVITTGQQSVIGNFTWLSVSFNGQRGWMPRRYLRRSGGGNTGGGGGSAPITNAANGVTYFVTNVNSFASLRRAPTTQSARLSRVPRGSTVITTGSQTRSGGYNWLSVSFNGQRGWMPRRFLGRSGGGGGGGGNPTIAFPVGSYRIVNVNNWASLRARTNRSSNRITTVPRGQSVYFNGQRRRANGETWLRVDYAGFVGWMPTQYLRKN
ncbi:MAG: SH3 domain-containing protein [Pseudomonadota bacterium]